MDKCLILAVAGSGKTTHIVNKLDLDNRHLIVTYTRENIKNLHLGITNRFGYFPDNISLFSFFGFLYSFCYKPFLGRIDRPKGLYWDFPPEFTRRIPERVPLHFFTADRRIYHNRLSKYLIRKDLLTKINTRIEKYFDHFNIDEIQDFGGYDFDLLMSFAQLNMNLTWVGDFYQHTYDTSRDGNRNQTLHQDFDSYKGRFEDAGFEIDDETLLKSWRCSPSVTGFITNQLDIIIESHKTEDTSVLYVEDQDVIDELMQDPKVIKLFFKNHVKYSCYSNNWGKLKGANHLNDVCVVLNPTSNRLYERGRLKESAPLTRNKLYVAFSRANGNLYLIAEDAVQHFKV
jgi:hypothetical protein